MEVSREFVRKSTFLAGPLVLISYAFALSRLDDWDSLWGGVPETWITYIVPFMFLAAIGFLMYWWVALYKLDVAVFESGGPFDGDESDLIGHHISEAIDFDGGGLCSSPVGLEVV